MHIAPFHSQPSISKKQDRPTIIQDKSRKCLKKNKRFSVLFYNLGVIVTISFGLHSPQKEEGKELTVTSFKYLEATISNESPKTGDSLQE